MTDFSIKQTVDYSIYNKSFASGTLYACLLRQTNRNSNSVINDYTYIKTINILNTVSTNKKKASRMKWHRCWEMQKSNKGNNLQTKYTRVTILSPNVFPG